MLLKHCRRQPEYYIQFSFDYLYTFRIFEFKRDIHVQVWKQSGYDMIEEMFLTEEETKYLINQSTNCSPSETGLVRYRSDNGRLIWEKHEAQKIAKMDFASKDFEFVKLNSNLFDEAFRYVKSRIGVDWFENFQEEKKPENNHDEMFFSRRKYIPNYD